MADTGHSANREAPEGERIVAVIAAGGGGSRFGGTTPKQFVDLCGQPVFVRSVRAMLACPGVSEAVCAVPGEWMPRAAELLAAAELTGSVRLVEGGATRQESVARALESLAGPPEPALVLIHDAARPLVEPDSVERAVDAAGRCGAAAVAAPTTDTIATCTGGRLDAVLDRSALVNIQTPQVFRYPLIRQAHRRATEESITDACDDASLVLKLGHEVAVVTCPATNIKITGSADLELARLLLSRKHS